MTSLERAEAQAPTAHVGLGAAVERQPWIERRINRAYERMLAAKTECWRHAWGDGFLANVSARNAMRTVAEVRALEKKLGLR